MRTMCLIVCMASIVTMLSAGWLSGDSVSINHEQMYQEHLKKQIDAPFDPVISYNLGVAAYEQGKYAQAEQHFMQTTTLTNDNRSLLERSYFNGGNAALQPIVKRLKSKERLSGTVLDGAITQVTRAIERYTNVLVWNKKNENAKKMKELAEKIKALLEKMKEQEKQQDQQPPPQNKDQQKNKDQQQQQQDQKQKNQGGQQGAPQKSQEDASKPDTKNNGAGADKKESNKEADGAKREQQEARDKEQESARENSQKQEGDGQQQSESAEQDKSGSESPESTKEEQTQMNSRSKSETREKEEQESSCSESEMVEQERDVADNEQCRQEVLGRVGAHKEEKQLDMAQRRALVLLDQLQQQESQLHKRLLRQKSEQQKQEHKQYNQW